MSMKDLKQIEQYAIKCHQDTNHYYDKYLPYEFHLRMVLQVANDFNKLIGTDLPMVLAACWCHDLIEDARQSFSDVSAACGSSEIAEIVRAVTNNGRGRNRSERMPIEVYNDIRNVPYAEFVKLCDRIANVQYSKMTKSRMFDMYKNEYLHFKANIYTGEYKAMWDCLDGLFIK